MTLKQLLILAIFVLVPLINVLVRALKRRLAAPAPRESEPQAPETPARVRTLSSPLGPRHGEAGDVPQPPLVTEVLRSGRRPKVRIGSAREARRGILLMAVLGPCRGLEPPPSTLPSSRRRRES